MAKVVTTQWFCDFSANAKPHTAQYEIDFGDDVLGKRKTCSCAKHLAVLQLEAFNKGAGRATVTQVPTMEIN